MRASDRVASAGSKWPRLSRLLPAALAAAVGVALSVAAYDAVERREQAGSLHAFEHEAGTQGNILDHEISVNIEALVTIGGLYAAATFGMSLEQVLVFAIGLNVTAGLGAARTLIEKLKEQVANLE